MDSTALIASVKRLEAKVSPEPNTGCWLWTGAPNASGYAVLRIGGRKGSGVLGHRIMYEFAHGPIPSGLHVLHRCDVRCCVNPDHLYAGTNADNVRDCVARGRNTRQPGEDGPGAKMTWPQVAEARARRASGETFSAIASDFRVTRQAVWAACKGITWRVQ